MAAYRYGQVIFCAKWVMCVAVTLLVWGGAIWFGSLAWDQKQGAILGLMGFGQSTQVKPTEGDQQCFCVMYLWGFARGLRGFDKFCR